MKLAAVVLAAGQGTRMKSNLPKVLHPVVGKPMVHYALDAVTDLGAGQIALVIGHGGEQVRAALSNFQLPTPNLQFVEQAEQRGTGHAVLKAREVLQGKADAIVVTYADMPLLQAETLKRLVELHSSSVATLTMLTVVSDDSMAFGRILRDANHCVIGIVEESDATPEQLAIKELNCGVYCFNADWLWDHLTQLKPNGKKGEYYLTDLVALAVGEQRKIEAIVMRDVSEIIGVNTRVHLAQAENLMRERINQRLMLAGVTLIDPATTYIEPGVEIDVDTVIEPNTHLQGKTRIGANCRIGPNTIIRDSTIGDDCTILSSHLTEAIVEENVRMGPFVRLRPGAHLARDVVMGNYGEVKNSYIGEGSHIGHFSYIGDSELGKRVNIGAGTITCNYDGKQKNRTVMGDDVFIGSDTMLIAPVTIGARSRTGAGAVVNKDVPPDSLAVGSPARVIRKIADSK
ncbi:MAG: bifunctional UDP-N-acetylglucosamine diphosphorylase/glucosamine-1-phosphate N-acetyltransferase GlmU [Chloroflexi bacterium]|nr:bifunctional UDP-N-acetylglucosamine diphosphorylase/glucosamine-1-phosphate N-acetyltransferase GlmU [Chloroflexota bacterium]